MGSLKETWEMTFEEVSIEHPGLYPQHKGFAKFILIPDENINFANLKYCGVGEKGVVFEDRVTGEVFYTDKLLFGAAMSKPESYKGTFGTYHTHREDVKKALSEGKAVPMEVLKDF